MPSKRLESSGSWVRISSDPMKILSKCDHVRCTSNQMVMTWSAVDSFFCHVDTSSKKCAMNLDVNMFWSCTWVIETREGNNINPNVKLKREKKKEKKKLEVIYSIIYKFYIELIHKLQIEPVLNMLKTFFNIFKT